MSSKEAAGGDQPPAAPSPTRSPRNPSIDEFLVEPPRDIGSWEWLWRRDERFPVRSHRRIFGSLLVAFKKLFAPLVIPPQQDLWDRQRSFNLILLEHLQRLEDRRHDQRIARLEAATTRGLQDVMHHNDALFARVDQKLDHLRAETRDLWAKLGSALALAESAPAAPAAGLAQARAELEYLEFEDRFRGARDDIERRLQPYVAVLAGCGDVLDLGCGRGEALEVFARAGLRARGVDSSARMVQECRARGLEAETGDLLEVLAALEPESVGAIVSFHVIEHLSAPAQERLGKLAWRALRPGGKLVLETPNTLSLVVAARNFWMDPTHLRPVHPEALRTLLVAAGFAPVEQLALQEFAASDRLPEIDLAKVPAEQHALVDHLNRLRDQLDDLLYGAQDYALIATRPL
jgi:O-antigen chain-terminating methyltransferase